MTALLMLLLAAAAHGHVAPARPPFRVRKLVEAPDARISLRVNATVVPTAGGYVEVSWGGVPQPAAGDIVAMYAEDAPPNASYPIKFVWAAQASPAYLDAGSGSYAFQILNYKTAVAFYFLRSGFGPAAVAARTGPVTLSAPDGEPPRGPAAAALLQLRRPPPTAPTAASTERCRWVRRFTPAVP